MLLTSNRTVDPNAIQAGVGFDAADIDAAFIAQEDPDEQLFYDLFSPDWLLKPVSEQLVLLSRLARLVEQSRASVLAGTLSAPTPKNGVSTKEIS